jgi:ribosomal protein S25
MKSHFSKKKKKKESKRFVDFDQEALSKTKHDVDLRRTMSVS